MIFRIILAIFCCHLVQGGDRGIDITEQCNSSLLPTPSWRVRKNRAWGNEYEDEKYNCPPSARCLNVLWTEFKPYSYIKDSTFMGMIPDLFRKLLDECGGNCWKIYLTANVSRHEIAAGKYQPYIDVVLPVYSAERKNRKVQNMTYVPLLDHLSVDFITKKESVSAIPKRLLHAIFNAWPVLLFALLLSLLSGVLLWFLELWCNPEQFPRSFFKGSWEGFWWAFVSMTTVGYGDRAPRSILGRSFAISWIMIGICICSIFTATLTTSLTTITLEETKTLGRSKVGAIRRSLEAYAGVTSKAKVIDYNTSKELWNALYHDEVDGILLDSFVSATRQIRERIEDNDYKVSQTVQVKNKSYGILVRDKDLTKCFKWTIEESWLFESDDIYGIITQRIHVGSKPQENEAVTRSDSIFNRTSDIFYLALYVCIGFAVVMLIAGLSWEFFFMDKFHKQSKTGSPTGMNANATNLDQMEKQMIADIQKMYSMLRTQRNLEIGIPGPIQVGDIEMRFKRNGRQSGMAQNSLYG